jgi:hypothetical protein
MGNVIDKPLFAVSVSPDAVFLSAEVPSIVARSGVASSGP